VTAWIGASVVISSRTIFTTETPRLPETQVRTPSPRGLGPLRMTEWTSRPTHCCWRHAAKF